MVLFTTDEPKLELEAEGRRSYLDHVRFVPHSADF